MVLALMVAVAFTPFTGGLSLGLVAGGVGILLSLGALAVAIVGTLEEDDEMLNIAMWAGLAGSAAIIGAGIYTRLVTYLAQQAAKAAAKVVGGVVAGGG